MRPSPLLCFLALLRLESACAFSHTSATSSNARSFQYRLVEHTDKLQQPGRDHEPARDVPPPHLFRIPAPGGDVCLVVDEKGGYHAVRDACPPLGLPISHTAVVDSQVDAIGDTLFGTRFDLHDGTVRGPWCPGGGTAGPLLLRLARRRRYHRLARVLLAASRTMSWLVRLPFPRRRRWTPLLRLSRRPSSGSDENDRRALEVLAVTKQSDGSLTVALPQSGASGHEGGDISWVSECGLAGYNF